jgi:1-aminocyclopropane-1-carboxylate deaminase
LSQRDDLLFASNLLITGTAMNLQRFPRHPLTFGPTPIQPLKRLSDHLGGKVHLYAKREDCNSGFAFGGNKTRKLEYLIPEALAQGCDTLVSIGGIQSNQTRQVAAVAAHLGMKCVLVQENWVNYSDAVYDRVGNIQMSRILGADVRLVADGFDIGFRKSWEDALESVRAAGGKPYAIPAGCSDHPLGGLGFVGFAEEVRQQEAELGFKFDYIVVCSVTGSTQAGMVVGFAADGRAERVIGIDASAKPAQTREQIIRIAKQTAEKVELGRDITSKDVVLDERFGGPEYGLPNDGTLEAIRLCARLEGMLTDPVYEGKSMAALIDLVRSGRIEPGCRVLYAHLGGQPALNAYAGAF